MNVASAVLLIALTAFTLASLLGVLRAPLLRALRRLSPRTRVRWLLASIAAPLLGGLAVIVVAIGHCVAPRLLGLTDDCAGPLGLGCGFCIYALQRPGLTAALVSSIALAPLLFRSARIARGVWLARRARARLQALARRDHDGVWHVPGLHAFVIGWPAPAVCIGDELSEQLEPAEVHAVAAHEHEHRNRGDVVLRAIARVLAVAHLPSTAQALLEALDLAIEQACDEEASRVVADPLIVAQALLRAARLQARARGESVGCAPSSLPARIEALCGHGAASNAASSWAWGGLLAFCVVALLGNHHVHHAAELLTAALPR